MVEEKTRRADDVVSLRLVDPGGHRLPDWAPGAHIDLLLPGGLTRQYSLCGDRWDPLAYEVAVLRERHGRGGSAYIHDRLQPGDRLDIGGPRNNFHLVPADRYLFIAGGIGITPLIPMIAQASLLRIPWMLLYGGRTRTSMAYLDALSDNGDKVTARPQDEFGLLELDEALAAQPVGTKIYCCGPEPLLQAVQACAADRPVGHLRLERFVPKDQPPPLRTTGFEVQLGADGPVVRVAPGCSVLDALEAAGTNVLSSCRQGTCGTCETGVLAGEPDHRDSLLTDEERARSTSMFVCVSRSCSDRLVLDL